MPTSWHVFWHTLNRKIYYHRVQVLNKERLPARGPTLYLGIHRNGAVDGFVYREVAPRAEFMVAARLVKSLMGKVFFGGIEVVRAGDSGDRSGNDTALARCRDVLLRGGALFVFPEGTSTLGPRHLRFHRGAPRIILDYLEAGGEALNVIPLGICYECPWALRSNVEVIVGAPLSLSLPPEQGRDEHLQLLMTRMTEGLEAVSVNVETAEYRADISRLAYISTLGTSRSYFRTLKALEGGLPEGIEAPWSALKAALEPYPLRKHQDVALMPIGPMWPYVAALLVLGPIVVAAAALNAVPLCAGALASRKMADGANVIALWRILVGNTLFCVMAPLTALTLLFFSPLAAGLYVGITLLGLISYYRVRKLAVAVHNGLRFPKLRPELLAFHQRLIAALPEETP
jgi:1-acyl-sn-glycerol-3-phosphate acyltransferase